MAKKVKRISINALEQAVADYYIKTGTIDWRDIEIDIKHTLSLEEMLTFVDSVVRSCFPGEDGGYIPEIKRFVIKCNIINMYTNVSLPANTDKKYELICNMDDLIGLVLENVNRRQFDEIVESIDEKIDYIIQTNASAVGASVNDMMRAVEDLKEKFGDMFADITAEDMKNIITTLSSGTIDEDKIVEALIGNKYGEEAPTE